MGGLNKRGGLDHQVKSNKRGEGGRNNQLGLEILIK